jgi:hypothetical protein
VRKCARTIAFVSIFIVLGALSGCTPADLPMTALRSINGQPTLLVLSCKDFHATRIRVYTVVADPPRAWTIDWSAKPAPPQVTLLTTPAGWTPSEHTLTEFTRGTEYSVSAYSSTRPHAIGIDFTIEELDKLLPGQVLVGESGSRRHAVAESTFRADAQDACN